ncbi:hypothetical protein [Marivirga sp.]|uniref:hypothetical protein n=1 Tax=Marivirga sp. TaxID=2018662 RepID=UPI003DA77B51
MEFNTNDIIVWLESKRREIPREFMSIIEDEGHDQAKIRQRQMANEYQMLSTAIDKLSQLKNIDPEMAQASLKNKLTQPSRLCPSNGHHISPEDITNEILGLKRFTA